MPYGWNCRGFYGPVLFVLRDLWPVLTCGVCWYQAQRAQQQREAALYDAVVARFAE